MTSAAKGATTLAGFHLQRWRIKDFFRVPNSDAGPQTGFKTEPRRSRRKDGGSIGGRPN